MVMRFDKATRAGLLWLNPGDFLRRAREIRGDIQTAILLSWDGPTQPGRKSFSDVAS